MNIQNRNRTIIKILLSTLVWMLGMIGAAYVLNPLGGAMELIDDATPLLGNLDEFCAAVLALAALRYFGIDVCNWLFPTAETPDTSADNTKSGGA
jgi:hypothetical protein